MKTIAVILMTSMLAVALAGCSGAPSAEQTTTAQSASETAASETAVDPAEAVVTDEYGTRVTLEVTKEGFVPAEFHVPAGKPVTLSVTRRVEKTCATEIVMKDFDINQDLPLDTTVEVTFRPTEPGEHRFACGMDMIAGKVIVD